jgi:hypothetical protein
MKVLYINSPEADYMQDLLYSGLVKVCGAEQVYDFPMNFRYHFVNKKYPRNLGLNRRWQSLKRWIQPLRNDWDLVVVGSCKNKTLESYHSILPLLPQNTPVVLIDGGDQTDVGGDLVYYKSPHILPNIEQKRRFNLIFKREFLPEYTKDSRLVPLPFCMNLDRIPKQLPTDKKYDVSFWAVESHPIRTKALQLLETEFDCAQNGTVRNQQFHHYKRKGSFYLEELARCKIVLNLRGGGWDTMRYWEVPAVGSLMITQKPGIQIPNDFVHGQHVIHCKDDLSDLVDLCRYYLKNETERETIALAGQSHLKQFHTDIERAQTVLKHVQHLKNF